MKKANPKGVALFDVRTRAEAMYVGWPAMPTHWCPSSSIRN
jgi:hypothetical protein